MTRSIGDINRGQVRGYLLFAAKALVSLTLMWWLTRSINLTDLFERLDGAVLIAFLACTVLVCLMAAGLGHRWRLVARFGSREFGFGMAWKNVLIGYFFNQFLPSTIGGDTVRIWLVKKSGIPLSDAAASIVADRLIGFVALVLLCAAGLPLLERTTSDPELTYGLVGLIGVAMSGVTVLLLIYSIPPRFRVHGLITWLIDLSVLFRRSLIQSRSAAKIVGLSLILHGMLVMIFIIFAHAARVQVNPLDLLVLVPPILLVSAAPVSIGGWGVREGVAVFAFGKLGVPGADALLLSTLFGATHTLAGMIGGGVWMRESLFARSKSSDTGS